jgi:Arc/MetJ family transcription regulator
MRTNVTLDQALVGELLRLSGKKTKTAAVTAAIKEQIRWAKRQKLASLLGSIRVEEPDVNERSVDKERDDLISGEV